MTVINKKEPLILAAGDLILLALSLVASLILRSQSLPTREFLNDHIVPFSIIFAYSILVFYISGLYGRRINLARSALPGIIIRAQIVVGLIATAIFYLSPAFEVAPKTTLVIYIILSSLLLILWRTNTYALLSLRKRAAALVIGSGSETEELISEMKHNPRSSLVCEQVLDPNTAPSTLVQALRPDIKFRYIVADLGDQRVIGLLPQLYTKLFPEVTTIDIHELYEDIFDRIPLSCIDYGWIMKNVSSLSPTVYDFGKRAIDIVLSLFIAVACAILYPFVALAIKLEDRGPVFITQERVGKNNKPIYIYKFRSMQRNESDRWVAEGVDNKVTRVGLFIRKTRIDEFPQVLSVLKGDMSLIGPRSDVVGLSKRLEQEIPYYSIRTVIKPGLSGWAQINQEKPPQSVEETKIRLSYDLYYIKHRSLNLDMRIALRTIKTLLSRVGM